MYTCEVIVRYLSPLFPTSCYETGSYTGSGDHQRSRSIALCVLGTSILQYLVLGLQMGTMWLGFIYGCWAPNSDFPACTAGVSPTEPSPQTLLGFLKPVTKR